jgi:hypothetical protein
MLATGVLTLLSVRGTRPTGPTLYLDVDPEGFWIVRPFFDDPSARPGRRRPRPPRVDHGAPRPGGPVTGGARPDARRHLAGATTGPIEPIELQALLVRMAAATTEAEVTGVLDELLARSIVGRPRIIAPELPTAKKDFTDPVGQGMSTLTGRDVPLFDGFVRDAPPNGLLLIRPTANFELIHSAESRRRRVAAGTQRHARRPA